ncbi:MAG: gliding motility-associated C-terminal domain-containing protein [Opitutaceae bacterium]|nr:gliding motility-associated C-terminal domain-containing protein [Cytophagales bacterium]
MIKYLSCIKARHLIVNLCFAFPIILSAQPFERFSSIETSVFNGSSIIAEKYILILPGFTVDGNSNVDKFYTYSIDTSSCMIGSHKKFTFTQGDSGIVEADAAGNGRYSWEGPKNFKASGLSIKVSIRDTGQFQYFVTNSRHCSLKQDTVVVQVNLPFPEKVKNEDFVIYNAVSPNGDGKNEVFEINGIDQFPNNKLQIFNRWGDKVYSANNYDNDHVVFDGKNLPTGTYYYILDKGNGDKLLNGYLILSR